MNCNKCGDCCTFFKLPIEGLNEDARVWLVAHKNVMLGGGFLYFKSPCQYLIRVGKEKKCSRYETRFECCKKMAVGSKHCIEAKEVKKIFE